MKSSRMLTAIACAVVLFGSTPAAFAQRGGGGHGGGVVVMVVAAVMAVGAAAVVMVVVAAAMEVGAAVVMAVGPAVMVEVGAADTAVGPADKSAGRQSIVAEASRARSGQAGWVASTIEVHSAIAALMCLAASCARRLRAQRWVRSRRMGPQQWLRPQRRILGWRAVRRRLLGWPALRCGASALLSPVLRIPASPESGFWSLGRLPIRVSCTRFIVRITTPVPMSIRTTSGTSPTTQVPLKFSLPVKRTWAA